MTRNEPGGIERLDASGRMDVFLELYGEPLPERLEKLREEALWSDVPIIRPQMIQMLRFLLRTKKPNRILEIGTAVGFSALLMREYAPEGCRIVTIENDAERIRAARGNFARFGVDANEESSRQTISFAEEACSTHGEIKLLEGDAAHLLPVLPGGAFDFLFLDAAKGQYLRFLPECKRLLAPGGMLLADNCFQGGDVLESRYAVRRRDRTIHARMREFLYEVSRDPELETCILPIADGTVMSVRKGGAPDLDKK